MLFFFNGCFYGLLFIVLYLNNIENLNYFIITLLKNKKGLKMSENITEGTVGRLSSPKNVENIEKNIKNIRKQMRNFAEHKENMSNKDKEIENQKMSEIRDNFDKLLKKEIKELKIDDTEIINSNAFSEMMEKKLIQENKNDSITLSYTFTTKAIDPILNYYKILFPDLK